MISACHNDVVPSVHIVLIVTLTIEPSTVYITRKNFSICCIGVGFDHRHDVEEIESNNPVRDTALNSRVSPYPNHEPTWI